MILDDRFELLEPLGAGGGGAVYRAWDRKLKAHVALKTVHSRDAEDIYRLKREFRQLTEIHDHACFVSLHELHAPQRHQRGGFQVYFTMECIEGKDFVTYVRAGPEPPESRLANVLPQLVDALAYLHGLGRIHRDIKPSNVLVTSSGSVVVLDFGLSADPSRPTTLTDEFVGTLRYAAPEQIADAAVPASDCYSVGVMAYEALTGRIAFEGRLDEILRHKSDFPPQAALADVSAPLREVVMSLMAPDPAQRPSTLELLRHFPLPQPKDLPTASSLPPEFVGRAAELQVLVAAVQSVSGAGGRAVVIEGSSGIGKSALLNAFRQEIEDRCEVISGRCHLREIVPFKVLDPIVDEVTRRLGRLSSVELGAILGSEAAEIYRLFPVIGRIPRIRSLIESGNLSLEREPKNMRRRSFEALAHLLMRIAGDRPLVLLIDDAQWGDIDSLPFFQILLQYQGVLVVFSHRSEVEERGEFVTQIASDGQVPVAERLVMQPLPQAESSSLVRRFLGTRFPDSTVSSVVQQAGGNPLLAIELSRQQIIGGHADRPLDIEALVRIRVQRLEPRERLTVQLIARSGGPCSESLLFDAMRLGTDGARLLGNVRRSFLTREISVGSDVYLDTLHDRVRDAVNSQMSLGRARRLNAVLALTMQRQGNVDPLEVVDYFIGAGLEQEAAEIAVDAADRAFKGLAFLRAARLLRFALEHTSRLDQARLRSLLGEALAQAGRGAEAGEAFEAAGESLDDATESSLSSHDLKRLAAEQFLRSGYHERGRKLAAEVLRMAGERFPTSTTGAIAWLTINRMTRAVYRAGLLQSSHRTTVPAAARRRMDACWTAAAGFAWTDTIISAAFQMRHAALSFRHHDPIHRLRALSTESVYQAVTGGHRRREKAKRALAKAHTLSESINEPIATGLYRVCGAGTAYFSGEFEAAAERSLSAETFLKDSCTGVSWELTNVHIFSTWALAHRGDIARLRVEVPRILDEAQQLGDRLALISLRCGLPSCLLACADGEPDRLDASIEDALKNWSASGFQTPHYYALVSRTIADMWRGDAERASNRIEETWQDLRRSGLLLFQLTRCELLFHRGRCAAALARDSTGEMRRQGRQIARRSLRLLQREDFGPARGWAASLAAALAVAEGSQTEARTALQRAERAYRHCNMDLSAAIAADQAEGAGGRHHVNENFGRALSFAFD